MKLNIEEIRKNRPITELLRFSIINLDKPCGPTSFSVSQYVKNSIKVNKTSHFGTLDPAVSGVLPVALGRACRLNEYFMHRNKTYIGIMRLHEDVSDKSLRAEIKSFIGKIKQLPPVRSRVKRAIREREVISFDILEKEGKDVLFKTEVQAGTYIRKLIHDIGENLGGAHMLELRRTQAGLFSEPSVTLYALDEALKALKEGDESKIRAILIPADFALSQVIPFAEVKSYCLKQLLTGKPLMKSDIIGKIPEEEIYSIFHKDRLIAVVKKTDEEDIIARSLFVLN